MADNELRTYKRRKYPEVYELVIGTVEKIFEHGAFIRLDEYSISAYCPLNEVSRSWFRGIREVLKIGQKRVFKVIRVDESKGHVDVSLKRVSDQERREKMYQWKREQRAIKLLELISKNLRVDMKEVVKEVGWKLEDAYGEMYAGLEEVARRGEEALREANVGSKWIKAVIEVVKDNIEIPLVKITGIFSLRSLESDGVKRIKKALMEGLRKVRGLRDLEVRMYVVGSPRYRVEVKGRDYKSIEKALREIVEGVNTKAKELGCEVTFEREKH